jgi:membrane fusion protein, multidrug efflux system
MRRRLHLRAAAVGLAIASAGAALAQTAPPAPAVLVTPVASREVTDTSDFVGRVTAVDKVDIVARVPGFIEQRLFTEGQMVKKGDLLFRIEQATYQATVEQQRANLAKAKATQTNAALQLGRGKELLPKEFIPKASVDTLTATEATAQADVLVAQAALQQAQINLDYTEIHTPIAGRIGLATFTVGNLVGPSSGNIATIVSLDPIYVIFQASERDVLDYKRRIATGGDANGRVAVRVKLPDGSLYPQPGAANFLDIQVSAATDTIAVRAQFPNPQGLLVPDGIVGVTIQQGEPRSMLVVPQSAVQLDQAGSYVLIVDPANRIELRRVTTGTEQGRDIVVSAGVKAGERIVVEGIQKVRPGQIVSASPAPGN